ncbi:MAG: ATP-dependent zinc metalloprotease FtsH [Syntrophobacteria bacterium]
MSPFYKNLALWLVISLMVILLFNMFNHPTRTKQETSYSEFISAVSQDEVGEVTIQGNNIYGKYKDGTRFQTFAPNDPDLIAELREKGVRISAKPAEESPWYMTILISWFPMLLLIAVWIFFMRQMQAGGGKAMSFGKSRARLLSDSSRKVTFEDVAGIEEAKEELQEIIEFLRDPKRFTRLGGRIPKGVLLLGPPGTGKTLLARAIAGEAGVPFFNISGSDFVEMFVGVGASRVRDLFVQGKKNAPCIIFVDEMDAVGRHRGAGLGGGHDEREQTLNQLLVEMDGFESNDGVILISATNRPDVLDPALLRPGRFDRQVVVPLPDLRGREGILHVHVRKTPLAPSADLSVVARGTPGFSGADLENLVNEAALLAARQNKEQVEMVHLELAKEKVLMGTERKSMIMSEEEKRNTAYHEVGHALVSKFLPRTDPVHKVSIIPRGRALGVTMTLPIEDRLSYDEEYMKNTMAKLLGGRVAEELTFARKSSGASDDIEKATSIARKMVMVYGMSKAMGPIAFGQKEEQIFLGREIAQHRDYSEQTAIKIDEEVRCIVDEAYETARKILKEHENLLDLIARTLIEKETLEGREIDGIIDANKPGLEFTRTGSAEEATSEDRRKSGTSQPAPGPQEQSEPVVAKEGKPAKHHAGETQA